VAFSIVFPNWFFHCCCSNRCCYLPNSEHMQKCVHLNKPWGFMEFRNQK
jgi:hypothetical protein